MALRFPRVAGLLTIALYKGRAYIDHTELCKIKIETRDCDRLSKCGGSMARVMRACLHAKDQ